LEGSHSGLVRTLGKRVWVKPPRVRISYPPQFFEKGFGNKNMDKKTQTIYTYNESAEALALKFDSLGARIDDIKETFLLTEKKNPKVIEIGCCNGRDAQ
jgi:hypothetical protein